MMTTVSALYDEAGDANQAVLTAKAASFQSLEVDI